MKDILTTDFEVKG